MTTMTTSPTDPSLEPATDLASSPAPTAGLSRNSSFAGWFRAASPIKQWAVILAGALLIWVAADEWVWSAAANINRQNARMEQALTEGANRDRLVAGVRGAIPTLGRITVPRAERDGSEELSNAVKMVMADAGVKIFSWEVRPGGNMSPPPELVQLVGAETKLGKVGGELRFNARQEDVIKVIAGIEAAPEIESIARLKLSREASDKTVGVTMTVEAWVQLDRKRRGGM
jgi:hypothetical protein